MCISGPDSVVLVTIPIKLLSYHNLNMHSVAKKKIKDYLTMPFSPSIVAHVDSHM